MDKEKIKTFYAAGGEKERLVLDPLEGMRTKEIIQRYLSSGRMKIADLGGATGYYAFWLQEMGHSVTLFDLAPENIDIARRHAQQTGIQLTDAIVGDATNMPFADDQFDMALLLGLLYHLTERTERVKAIAETKRILKPGGIMLAAVISKYASLFDGFRRNLVDDDHFFSMLENDLDTGVHINKTNHPEYFTTAFFHTIADIKEEVQQAGLRLSKLIGIESFAWIADHFNERSSDEKYMGKLRQIMQKVESDEDLLAMSPHIMVVAEKK